MTRRLLLGVLCAASLAATAVPLASADGDPASDYLITQTVFLPYDIKVDPASATHLRALVAASRRAGFGIKVAVIANSYDLGSIPILYRKPKVYAQFLGKELFYWYKRELLIVMPNGYGVYDHGPAPAADRAAVAALPVPGTNDGATLVASAVAGVEALAKRRGIDLSHVSTSGPGSSKSQDQYVIAGGAAAVLALIGAVFLLRRRRGRGRR